MSAVPRLTPLDFSELPPDLAPVFDGALAVMGFLPNDALTMARKPALLRAMLALVQAVYAPGTVPLGLKKLIGLVSSSAAGCQYCVAHTGHTAVASGVDPRKLAAVWDYDSSPLFTESERAALDVARAAALVPGQVTDRDFAALRRHYDEEAIVEIIAVVALFGFLNRWNAALATELEDAPFASAARNLAPAGWSAGVHEPRGPEGRTGNDGS
jgi:uncharacterized peroxidase-related enzyme